ncbi:MAG: type II toxin-antitoxin system VapC family toxin [Prosthecobacter sp.]
MIILDTDHVSALQADGGMARQNLTRRMQISADQDFVITAVTVEEQLRGWLAEIHGEMDFVKQTGSYQHLVGLVRFFGVWKILPFDASSAQQTITLRKAKVRIGTMDLKIAATALSHNILLLTANNRDFSQVPGLRFENWLH